MFGFVLSKVGYEVKGGWEVFVGVLFRFWFGGFGVVKIKGELYSCFFLDVVELRVCYFCVSFYVGVWGCVFYSF